MSEQGTLLIVDDDNDVREFLVSLFKPYGLNVLESKGANEAFALLKQGTRVDVIVSDIKMKDGGGFELLAKISASGLLVQKPHVILITGFPTINLAMAKQFGALDLIAKPFDNKTLQRSVSKALISAGKPGLPV